MDEEEQMFDFEDAERETITGDASHPQATTGSLSDEETEQQRDREEDMDSSTKTEQRLDEKAQPEVTWKAKRQTYHLIMNWWPCMQVFGSLPMNIKSIMNRVVANEEEEEEPNSNGFVPPHQFSLSTEFISASVMVRNKDWIKARAQILKATGFLEESRKSLDVPDTLSARGKMGGLSHAISQEKQTITAAI